MSGICSSQPTSARSFHSIRRMETKHPLPRGFPGAGFRLGTRSQAPPKLRSCPEPAEGYNAAGPKYLICLQLPALTVESEGLVSAHSRIRAAGPLGLRAPLSKWGLSSEDGKARINKKGDHRTRGNRRELQKTGDSGREVGFQGHPVSCRQNVCAAHHHFEGNQGISQFRREM
jgi:hypothetical protein